MLHNSFEQMGLPRESRYKKAFIPFITENALMMGSTIGNYFINKENNAANVGMQRETNQANKEMADQQMRFQEQMSNSAHQREVKDLIAAGLNPNLSAGGNGSSTPSGAMGTAVAPRQEAFQIPDLIGPLLQVTSLSQNQQRIDNEKQLQTAQIAKSLSDKDLNKMKEILAQKGMGRATLEGEAVDVLRKFLYYIKNAPRRNNPKGIIDEMNQGTERRFP